MGGRGIRSHEDLDGFFLDYFVGDTIHMDFVRNGRKMDGELVLKEFSGR
jgi:hypothetical protein